MIECRVIFWDPDPPPGGLAEVFVVFEGEEVEVSVRDTAWLSEMRWDESRAEVSAHGHDKWSETYAGTPLEQDLVRETMNAETMMAIGALHLLAPTSGEAHEFEADPALIPGRYARQELKDGLGNRLGLLGVVPSSDIAAATELMTKGLLQKLIVQVVRPDRPPFRHEVYFVPFHAPTVPTSTLSSAALALKGKIPDPAPSTD